MDNSKHEQKKEIYRIERALLKKKLLKSYYHFFKYFWECTSAEKLEESFHLKYLCDELQKVGEWVILKDGERKEKEYDLLINISPGESKSSICSILFPVWLWVRDATVRIISSSNAGSLSIELATKSRDIIKHPLFQEMFGDLVKMDKDNEAKSFYKTEQKGFRLSTSTGARIIGNHAHIILVDDPLDPTGLSSDPVLSKATKHVNETLHTRKVDKRKTPIIMIMQRLHENDPSGSWVEKSKKGKRKVKHICLPASSQYEIYPKEDIVKWRKTYEKDEQGHYVHDEEDITIGEAYERQDGLLNPYRTDWEVLEDQKDALGHAFPGQFGQNPVAFDGEYVKDGYLQVVDRTAIPNEVFTRPNDYYLDTAMTAKEENDPTGIINVVQYGSDLYILDYHHERLEIDDLVKYIRKQVIRTGKSNSTVYIENKANGINVYQFLRKHSRLNVLLFKIDGKGDKVERLKTVLPFLRAKRVFLLKAPWNTHFITECKGFPRLKHDEAIDCLTMSLHNTLLKGTGRPGRRSSG